MEYVCGGQGGKIREAHRVLALDRTLDILPDLILILDFPLSI